MGGEYFINYATSKAIEQPGTLMPSKPVESNPETGNIWDAIKDDPKIETAKFPSDDSGIELDPSGKFELPDLPSTYETLAYPSDDGGPMEPRFELPSTYETLAYPSDDGGLMEPGFELPDKPDIGVKTMMAPSDDAGIDIGQFQKPELPISDEEIKRFLKEE